MISIKNSKEIAKMRESNRIVGLLLHKLRKYVVPGVTTWELNKIAEEIIYSEGGKPAFKGYTVPGLAPFPAAVCASVNSCIVHGIPSKSTVLSEGDIIGVDVGVYKDGYYGDAARTYMVGEISEEAEALLDVTQEALELGINAAKVGNRIGDISSAIGNFATAKGYFIADNLTGHGIGKKLHEDPMIPNFGIAGKGPRLRKGMTLAIEPMINIGTNCVQVDGWEYYTLDGSLSAHFENTILITDGEPEILSIY
jgi:methionyl aminopeptidase